MLAVPPETLSVPSTMFILGEPMNSPTKTELGYSYRSLALST